MMPKPNDRVSPDRPDEETPSKRGNRLAIGLLTLAAGAVAIVALTQPDPPPHGRQRDHDDARPA